MTTRLRNIHVDEVSACRRGANAASRIRVRKSGDDATDGGAPLSAFMGSIRRAFAAMTKMAKSDGPESEAELTAALDAAESALAAPFDAGADDGADAGAPEGTGAEAVGAAASAATADPPAAPLAAPAAPITKTEDDMAQNDQGDTSAAVLAKAQSDAADAIAKAETIQKQLDELLAEKSASIAKAAVVAAIGDIPAEPAQIDLLAKAWPKLDADEQGVVTALLAKAAALAADGGALVEVGTRQMAKAGGALAQLTEKATTLAKADPSLSEAQAFDRAVEQNPKLYDAYLAESR